MGKDFESKIRLGERQVTLAEHIDKTTFPGVQGTPYLNNVAAKAVFFKETLGEQYRARQFKIISNAQRLAAVLANRGYDVLTGGTDNHMILINVANLRPGLTGLVAQKALEQVGLIVNMNRLPYDSKPAFVTSGLRLGTPIVTKNGMGHTQMDAIAGLIDAVLRGIEVISDTEYGLDDSLKTNVNDEVVRLSQEFPMR